MRGSPLTVVHRLGHGAFTTSPRAMTKSTFLSTVTSASGSPATAMMSADLPGSIVPDFARQAEQVGGVDRRRLQRLDRRHAIFDHQLELVGVAAVLGNAGVGAEGDLDPRRTGLGERLAGDADAPVDLLLHLGRISVGVLGAAARDSRSRSTASAHNRSRAASSGWRISSSITVPCSIESAPARSASLMPSAPWAWTATLRP